MESHMIKKVTWKVTW